MRSPSTVQYFAYAFSLPLIFFAVKIAFYLLSPEYTNAHEQLISLVAAFISLLGAGALAVKVESTETTTEAVDIDNKTLLRIFVRVTAIAVAISLLIFAGLYIYLRMVG